MRPLSTLVAVLMVPIIFPLVFSGQGDGTPVPTELLHNGRLIVPELNFAVGSTDTGSHWSMKALKTQGAKTTAFSVDSSADEQFTVIVSETGTTGGLGSPSQKKAFVEHMQKSLPAGWRVDPNPTIEETSVPLNGSWKIRATLYLPNDSVLYAYMYSTSGRYTYMMMDYSPAPTEPASFKRFVSTFAVLKSTDNISSSSHSTNWTAILGEAVIAGWLFGKVNKAKLRVLLAVALAGIWLALLFNLRSGEGTQSLFEDVSVFFAAGLATWGYVALAAAWKRRATRNLEVGR
jgi:hypothetical protein